MLLFLFTASARITGLYVVSSRYEAYKQQVNRKYVRQTEIINYKLTDRRQVSSSASNYGSATDQMSSALIVGCGLKYSVVFGAGLAGCREK